MTHTLGESSFDWSGVISSVAGAASSIYGSYSQQEIADTVSSTTKYLAQREIENRQASSADIGKYVPYLVIGGVGIFGILIISMIRR